MTIKEFARLCGCNPQTIRYYDHMNLLKPVKVDSWSGYRFYEEEQALVFVKIKNLQRAGFAIEEIKKLLEQDNEVIYEAFHAKIAELEKKLQEIRSIQKSYQTEMSQMEHIIKEVRQEVFQAMQQYDPAQEFGIDAEAYKGIIDSVNDFYQGMISKQSCGEYTYSDFPDGEEETECLSFLDNPEYEIVYEKHDWEFVKDFLEEFAALMDGQEYALYFEVTEDKANNTAFANTMLGILMKKNRRESEPDNVGRLGCNVTFSKDGRNHFWLLKLK